MKNLLSSFIFCKLLLLFEYICWCEFVDNKFRCDRWFKSFDDELDDDDDDEDELELDDEEEEDDDDVGVVDDNKEDVDEVDDDGVGIDNENKLFDLRPFELGGLDEPPFV